MRSPPKQSDSALSRLFAPERRAWRGQATLPRVFWGYGVAVSVALGLMHLTAIEQGQLALRQAMILVSAVYTVWIVVAIWRTAERATAFWGSLARWMTVAWALNSAFILLFLQVDLVLDLVRG